MGVADEFSRFKDAYNMSAATIGSISYRYKRITRQLNADFWASASDTAHSLYVESYGRDTAATGLSDVDIAFMLPSRCRARYGSLSGNGQSALLQAVRRSVRNTYPASEVSGDGQVVAVEFSDGIRFEVLPVLRNAAGTGWTYPNANAGGSWKTCNPRAEISAVQRRSDATNRNLKHLCRTMRVWRDHNGVAMSGMLLDTLSYQFIERYEHRRKSFLHHGIMARDFLLHLSRRDASQRVWRAPGSGSHVHRTGSFRQKARASHALGVEAIRCDDDSHAWSRRRRWRDVFGPLFPNA